MPRLEAPGFSRGRIHINPDGTIGQPVLDNEGVSYINECVSEAPSDVEAHCHHCHISFRVHEHGDGFELGDAI